MPRRYAVFALVGILGSCAGEVKPPARDRATVAIRVRDPGATTSTSTPSAGSDDAAVLSISEADRGGAAVGSLPDAGVERRRRRARNTHAIAARATDAPLGTTTDSGWVCARVTQGVRVDPDDLGPCQWVRAPSCPGMHVVFHTSGTGGLVGTCAASLPP